MAFAVFGPGSLYITRTDIANATPVNIGYAQEFSLDEAGDTKQLYGQDQYPLAAARATIKATGKAKAAMVSAIALNAVFHGETFASGQLIMAPSEPHVIPATPYTVTIAPPNTGTFNSDLGVTVAATNLPYQKVATSPATGQYAVDATTGVYTFAAADTTVALLITYSYTVAGSGQKVTITNKLIGSAPTFQIDYATSLQNKPYYLRIFQCISGKLSQQFKLTDFMMPEVDFDIFANPAGNVYQASYPDVG